MKSEIKVPAMGESITEATVGEIIKASGSQVRVDDELLELETDKVNQVIYASVDGVVQYNVSTDDVVTIGQVIGYIDAAAASASESNEISSPEPKKEASVPEKTQEQTTLQPIEEKPTSPFIEENEEELAPQSSLEKQKNSPQQKTEVARPEQNARITKHAFVETIANTPLQESKTPSSSFSIEESKSEAKIEQPVRKEEPRPEAKIEQPERKEEPKSEAKIEQPERKEEPKSVPQSQQREEPQVSSKPEPAKTETRPEHRKRMSKIRQVIAQRLVDVQQQTAMLTTFNEVDLSQVMALRKSYQEQFQKKYGVKLGFMSFFVKAAVSALQAFPEINAYVDGNEIVYREYYDIGIAVGTERGLVVPVVRGCDSLSYGEIEKHIADMAVKARDGAITVDDLQGGGFTITNGGIYGSLLSTPILNPPQSAILGMHTIQKRPVVVDDQITIRPMMYLALSYDHRIVDGKEAVSFLVHIKNLLEDPARQLLEV